MPSKYVASDGYFLIKLVKVFLTTPTQLCIHIYAQYSSRLD